MRRVIKGTEPTAFTDWKAQASDDWSPTYSTLQNPQKRELHLGLLAEQHNTCCYCGSSIKLTDSHIEHFRPQERYGALALDYGNLHASCIRAKDPGSTMHCGHLKAGWFDEDAHISPLAPDCEQRFRYLLTGEMQPTSVVDQAAVNMICILGLDIASLNNRREQALLGFFDESFIGSASREEILRISTAMRLDDLYRDTPFSHVVARYSEQLLSQ